jgi:hypothetical protein
MIKTIGSVLLATGLFVLTSVAGPVPVAAQGSSSPALDKNAVILIPGTMTGPGTMGPRGYRRLCTPRSVGLYEWQVRWVERVVRPSEAQRASLSDLQSASSKALATMATACKGERPETMKAQMAMMEARLDAMSQAVKTFRPAFEAFYALLDGEQQRRLDVVGPGRHGWHW